MRGEGGASHSSGTNIIFQNNFPKLFCKAAPESCPPKIVTKNCSLKIDPQSNYFSKKLFFNFAEKIVKTFPQSDFPKLLPEIFVQNTSKMVVSKLFSKVVPENCSPMLLPKTAPRNCVLKLFPKAIPHSKLLFKTAVQSCSSKLLPKSALQSCLPKPFPEIIIESCSEQLLKLPRRLISKIIS